MSDIIAGVVALITLVLAFGKPEREQHSGQRRWMWLLVGIGLLEVLLMPTWPQRLLLYLVLLHIQLSIPPSAHERYLMQVLIAAGAYLILYPYVKVGTWAQELITPFLWMLVGLGVMTTVWSIVSLYFHFKQGHLQQFGRDMYRKRVKVWLWEFDLYESGAIHIFCAGHLNSNFTQPFQCLAVAAGAGLAMQGSNVALYLLPILLFPLVAYLWAQRMVGQWAVHISVLAALVLYYFYGWMAATGLVAAGAVAIGVMYYAHFVTRKEGDLWWDNGRFREWYLVIWQWWRCRSWLMFIIGGGIRSWVQASSDLGALKANEKNSYTAPIFSNAHNEYIQQLFEYGVVGFIALLWYVGTVLVKAYALSLGLFWVACMLASAAALTFPWTFYHIVYLEVALENGQRKVTETRHGSPLLNWLTLLIALLVEV